MPRVIHFEIQAEDMDRAEKFYRDVFGWDFQKWDGPFEYVLVMTGKESEPGINGGLMPRKGPAPQDGAPLNAYSCVIEVEDIDEAGAAILKAGGTEALAKQKIPGIGWSAYYKDTEGNIFGLMQPEGNAKQG